MYLTDLSKTEEIYINSEETMNRGKATVRWLLGEPEGAPNFEMRYFSLTGDISTPWHAHDWEHQVFVVKGAGKLKTAEKEHDLSPGSAVMVMPGEQHCFTCSGSQFDFICVVPNGTRT